MDHDHHDHNHLEDKFPDNIEFEIIIAKEEIFRIKSIILKDVDIKRS